MIRFIPQLKPEMRAGRCCRRILFLSSTVRIFPNASAMTALPPRFSVIFPIPPAGPGGQDGRVLTLTVTRWQKQTWGRCTLLPNHVQMNLWTVRPLGWKTVTPLCWSFGKRMGIPKARTLSIRIKKIPGSMYFIRRSAEAAAPAAIPDLH